MSLSLSIAPLGSALMSCSDSGPWPCEEEGCPAPLIDCLQLATDGVCPYQFSQVFDTPPDGAPNNIYDACPRACGRCGLEAPEICTMGRLDAKALGPAALAQALVEANKPMVVSGAMEAWLGKSGDCWNYPSLLDAHGTLSIKVIIDGGRYRGEATEEISMPIHEYPKALRNGTLASDAYVFTDVQDELHCDELFRVVPPSHATRGRLILSMGAWGNGRPFHAHGPALFGLVHGTKRWFIRRPNASFAWQRYEVARDDLRESAELPSGWDGELWQCSQKAGELLWVPDLFQHSTLNYDAETVGFAMVIDELHPLTPLHKAAQANAKDEVVALLKAGADIEATAAGGATALHHAAGLGHCDAAEALLTAGASVHAKAAGGNDVSPLHAAAAGGHADAAAVLVRYGASLEALDRNGHTPLELATQLGHSAVVRVLQKAEADSL